MWRPPNGSLHSIPGRTEVCEETAEAGKDQCRKESGPYPRGSQGLKGFKQRKDLASLLERLSGQLGRGGWEGESLRKIQALTDGGLDKGWGREEEIREIPR